MTWTFRATGRQARVLGVESDGDGDIAVFRFLDNDQTTRRVPVRRFLLDFEKVVEPPGVLPFHSWG
jgi:hypothetical protein